MDRLKTRTVLNVTYFFLFFFSRWDQLNADICRLQNTFTIHKRQRQEAVSIHYYLLYYVICIGHRKKQLEQEMSFCHVVVIQIR